MTYDIGLRCGDCGTFVHLEVMQAGGGYVSAWIDYRGGSTHFSQDGSFPLMRNHSPELLPAVGDDHHAG